MMKVNYFKMHCQSVEYYLAGERDDPIICTTESIAKKLERKYNIKMVKVKPIKEEVGLYLFEIQ